MANRKRDKQIIVRTTADEKQQLQTLAAAAGLPLSLFLIGLALGDKIGEKVVDHLTPTDQTQTVS